MLNREQLEQAIAAQENLRAALGDTVVDATVSILREKLAALEHQSALEQRKLVTILFCDIVGSTALSEKLDPEDVLEIMDGALKAYSDAVSEYGGTVARLMGDGLLAFFGAPIGREDDAVRAVRCGLAIIQATRTYAATVAAEYDVEAFNVRVGLNTGPVALGEVGSAAGGSEWTAMGDAVNLAARLQSGAQPGTILISHDTYVHVRGVFETRTLEPMQFKGKSELIQVYMVDREKPRTFRVTTRGIEGVETHMVGRNNELGQLKSAFTWANEEHETQIVTIIGEPGVGKSRLLREFDVWLDERPESIVHFTGRATADMLKLPYALIRNMFAFRFDILESDTAAVARDKLERGIAAFLGAESVAKAHAIGNLIGFDFSTSPYLQGEDAQQITQLGQFAITEFFGKVAGEKPAVIFLDDIHWADDKSLDLVNHIIRAKRELHLLVVCLTRPALFERRVPLWMDQQDFHTRIELRPLSNQDTRALITDILRNVDVIPDDLCDLIVVNAEGNPFYVEEIIKMLLDDRVILKNDDKWSVDSSRLTDLRIPPTLTGVLQARLDALPPTERDLLQRASVVGRIFWDDVVSYLKTEEDQPLKNIPDALQNLNNRELIRQREVSVFDGTKEYIFRHTILHDVTYESVLRRLRRTYHEQVADWLVKRSGDRVNEYTAMIARHYEQAGQPQKAVTYFIKAVESALNISAYHEAIDWAEQALNLLTISEQPADGTRDVLEAQLLAYMGQAYRWLSTFTTARELYEKSLILFERVGDKPGIIKALYELGWLVGSIMRRYTEAEQYFQVSLSIAQEIEDKRGVAWAYNGLGAMAHYQGDYTEAIRYYQASLQIAREIGDQVRTAGALNNLGLVKAELGRLDEAQGDLEAGLQIFKTIGNRSGLASPIMNLGNLARFQGRHEEAEKLFREALTIYEETGDRSGVSVCLWSLGSLARVDGDYDTARQKYGEALAIAREIGSPAGIGSSLEDLAMVARLQGKYDEARGYLEEVLKMAGDVGDHHEIANALLNLGGVARAQNQFDEARNYLEDSIVMNMEHGNRRALARAILFLGDVALAQKDYTAARRSYQDSLAIYREFDHRLGVSLTLGGLGDVAVALGDIEGARQYFHEAYTMAQVIRDTPLQLWILTGIASLLAREKEDERAAELLGMVLNHYATTQETRDKAETVLSGLGEAVHNAVLSAALERGKGMANNRHQQRVSPEENRWLPLVT
ncbi:MAG: tetratricopeptide repeat protein [Anaerolineaceae bacterium]|nr:tetratricopeptide repeat protein [Anaerolineaceae bacterium]